jgi:cbb3-type cytochrome oxidase maturation protein
MDIIFVLVPLTLILVVFGCWAFFWAVDAGQFDDLDSPAWDAIQDDVAGRAVPAAERTPTNP